MSPHVGIATHEMRRLCLFAHFHPLGVVGEHVLIYLAALRAAGFRIILVSTSAIVAADRERLLVYCDAVLTKENRGLDFGSWAHAWDHRGSVEPDILLLANDSVYAPVGDLSRFIDELLSHPADFYGATKSLQYEPHLQSWFLMLRPAAYRSQAFQSRMRNPPHTTLTKWQLILKYEIGLTRDLAAEGLSYRAAYDPPKEGRISSWFACNPSHWLWRQLVEDYRVPFIKMELLRDNPHGVGDLSAWKDVVARYDERLADAIDADLRLRAKGRSDSLAMRTWRSLPSPHAYSWPELRSFLTRDTKLDPDSFAAKMNSVLFAGTRLASKQIRRASRRLLRTVGRGPAS